MSKIRNKAFFFIVAFLIILDQATKLYFKGFNFFGIDHQGLDYGDLVPVIGDFVQFTYILNPGMAFGAVFIPKIILSLFSIFAAIALAIFLSKLDKNINLWVKIAIMLILAGASGNLIDRVFYGVIFNETPYIPGMNPVDKFVFTDLLSGFPLFYGKVVDFIQVDIPDINFLGLYYTHWPVFNVADSCVSVGIVILIFVHNKLPSLNEVFCERKNKKSSKNKDITKEMAVERNE